MAAKAYTDFESFRQILKLKKERDDARKEVLNLKKVIVLLKKNQTKLLNQTFKEGGASVGEKALCFTNLNKRVKKCFSDSDSD
jgi:hypothetical protein